MLLKLGVDISRLCRPIRKQLKFIDSIFQGSGFGEAVVTSTYEGNHSPSSLHYADNAIDFRAPKETALITVKDLEKELKDRLGKDFDVILEGNHFHVEYDPKN